MISQSSFVVCGVLLVVLTPSIRSRDTLNLDIASRAAMVNTSISVKGSATRATGDIVAGPYDIDTPTGGVCLGVEAAWGHDWISARGVASPGHRIYRFTLSGIVEASFPQTTTSPLWRHCDLESDPVANKLWGGNEGGELVEYDYDPWTEGLSHSAIYVISGVSGTIRALARNPKSGHFFTADFGDDIYEFDLSGAVHNVYPNPGIEVYGAACNDTLWLFEQTDDGSGNRSHFIEYEVDTCAGTLTPTGCDFRGLDFGPGVPNIAAGCDLYFDGRNQNGLTLVGIHQNNPNNLVAYEVCSSGPIDRFFYDQDLSLPPLGSGSPPIGPCGSSEVDFDALISSFWTPVGVFGLMSSWLTIRGRVWK